MRTKSGIAMVVLHPGKGGEPPKGDDCVVVAFHGWDRKGTVRAMSSSTGEGATECLRQVVPGIAEALRAMRVGEARRAWIPAALAFEADDDRTEPPFDMTYDLELLEVVKAPPAPKDLKPPRSAVRTALGVALLSLRKGEGTAHPSETDHVTMHVSGWKSDGRLFMTTQMGKAPGSYAVAAMNPAWREAIESMVVGEKIRIWVPASLIAGRPGKPEPTGDLIYEMDLLAIE
jgi:peptidylprolyl isomerase